MDVRHDCNRHQSTRHSSLFQASQFPRRLKYNWIINAANTVHQFVLLMNRIAPKGAERKQISSEKDITLEDILLAGKEMYAHI